MNVSVRRPGEGFRTRCEVKNVNSIRFVMQAVEAEARRQVEVWESGGEVEQETRLFDTTRGVTRSMRSKEDAHDYRYFPDPDLPPLVLDAAWVESLRAGLPELPDAKRARYVRDLGLSAYDAGVLTAEREIAEYFEAVAAGRDAKQAANWVMGDLFAALNRTKRDITHSPVSAADLGALLDLIADGTLSGKLAKEVFEAMVETGKPPAAIVEEQGLRQVTDTAAIEAAVDAVLAAQADKVAEYKAGKEKLFGFFVGQVMKGHGGQGQPGAGERGAAPPAGLTVPGPPPGRAACRGPVPSPFVAGRDGRRLSNRRRPNSAGCFRISSVLLPGRPPPPGAAVRLLAGKERTCFVGGRGYSRVAPEVVGKRLTGVRAAGRSAARQPRADIPEGGRVAEKAAVC